MDKKALTQFVQLNTKNLTFLEAYQRTGVTLNIVVSDNFYDKSRLLNYITAPNVYIWSAAIASSSLPFAISPSKIYAKNKEGKEVEWLPMKEGFLDGSIGADIPRTEMSVFFNVSNLIVSQLNIHIVPFVKQYSFSLTGTKRYYLNKIFKLTLRLFLSELKLRIQ